MSIERKTTPESPFRIGHVSFWIRDKENNELGPFPRFMHDPAVWALCTELLSHEVSHLVIDDILRKMFGNNAFGRDGIKSFVDYHKKYKGKDRAELASFMRGLRTDVTELHWLATKETVEEAVEETIRRKSRKRVNSQIRN